MSSIVSQEETRQMNQLRTVLDTLVGEVDDLAYDNDGEAYHVLGASCKYGGYSSVDP